MEIDAVLEGLQHYTIHGGRYLRVFYATVEAPDVVETCQLPLEAFDESLRPGDSIRITMVLKTVMSIARPSPAQQGQGK